ncbi:type VI secretion system Vgr family protein [Nissabacter sp. SGAir0207]|uniref:type VI secretion system Vgr family protein n=1 Tax=Nissabacter sp. SGAir0207 TaxID=2126321 RepID=UPI0010CCEBAD|nr:type VI secretion system Vgr family protein [Nissabacter sp. SGAir0207]QCR38494.1 type VI secretion system tip protein VgrG [Nissabacter sp. SGAir0207]
MSRQMYNHSHHRLAVRDCTAVLDVLSFEGKEALSRPFHYAIEFTSPEKALTAQAMLMRPASLTLHTPVTKPGGERVQQPVRVVQGVVTAFSQLSVSPDEGHYALTLQPRLALLSRSRQNAIYQDMSVPQIVEHILRSRHGMRGQDFLFTLTQDYPRREQVMQYDEDDLAFIRRLLAGVGIGFRLAVDTRLNIDVVEFFDGPLNTLPGRVLAAVPPSGMHDRGVESVWAMAHHHQVVEKSVTTDDYNYREATQALAVQVDATGGDPTTYGEACHYAEGYLTAGAPQGRHPAPESGAFYARLHHERYLNRQTQLTATTNCAALSPGERLQVTGGGPDAAAFREGVLVTGLLSHARRDSSYVVRLTALPAVGACGFRPPLPPRRVMAGTLPARVTSTRHNDPYAHIDRYGRYRVNLLFDRQSWPAGQESLWVRQARPYAGDGWGLHLPLLAGTEVAIAFEDGNPDRPYIAGVLHDSAHPDPVTIQNYKCNILRTPAQNLLRLDDSRGQEHITLSTEYGGRSQLNLGYLVDEQKQPRGEGIELRSDSYGVIRAGRGLFISADAQLQARGKQREMQAALATLQQAAGLAESLNEAVKTAKAELAQIQAQKSLLENALNELQQPVLLMSAPAGIAQVSPQSIQISSGQHLIQTAAGNSNVSVFKKFTVAAGEMISLFAKSLGIKIFANRGKVEIQAQGDGMALTSLKEMHITSQEDEICLTAAKRLTLACHGSAIVLDSSGITLKTTGQLAMKAASHKRMKPENYTPPLPELPPEATCAEQQK